MGNTDDDNDFKEQMAARYQERVSMGYTSAGVEDVGREEKNNVGDFFNRGFKKMTPDTNKIISSDNGITAELFSQVYSQQGDMDRISNIAPAPSLESQSHSSTVMRELIHKFEKELPPEQEKKHNLRQQRKDSSKTSSLLARRIAREQQLEISPKNKNYISPQQPHHRNTLSEQSRSKDDVFFTCKESATGRESQDNTSKIRGTACLPYTGYSSPCMSDFIQPNDSLSFTGSATIQNITTLSSIRDRISQEGSNDKGHIRSAMNQAAKEGENNNIVGPKPPISPDKIPSFHRFTLKRKVSMGLGCHDGLTDPSNNSEKTNRSYKQRLHKNGQIQPETTNSKSRQDFPFRRVKRAKEGEKIATKAATSMERYLMFLKRSSTPTHRLNNFQETSEMSTNDGDNREFSQFSTRPNTPESSRTSKNTSEVKQSPRRSLLYTKKKYGMLSPDKLFKRSSSGSICSDSVRRNQKESTQKCKNKPYIDRRSSSQRRKPLVPSKKNTSNITLPSSADTSKYEGIRRTPRKYGIKMGPHCNRSLTNKYSSVESKATAKKLDRASSSTLSSHKSHENTGVKQEKVSKLLNRYEEAKNVLQKHQSRRSCDRENVSFDGSRLDGVKDLLLTEDEIADTNLVPIHLRKTHYLTPERSEDSTQIKDNVLDLLSGLSSTDEDENGYMYIADRLKQIKSNRFFRMLQSPDHSPEKGLTQADDDSLINIPGRETKGRNVKRKVSKPLRSKKSGSRANSQGGGTNSVVNYRSSTDSCVGKLSESSARSRRQLLRRPSTGKQERELTHISSGANIHSATSKDFTHLTIDSSPYSLGSANSSCSNIALAETDAAKDPSPFKMTSSPCLSRKSIEMVIQPSLHAESQRAYPMNSPPSPKQNKEPSVEDQIEALLQRKWHSISPVSSVSFSHQSPLLSREQIMLQKLQNHNKQLESQQSVPTQRVSRANSEPCDIFVTSATEIEEIINHDLDIDETEMNHPSPESVTKKRKKAGKKYNDKEKPSKKNKKRSKEEKRAAKSNNQKSNTTRVDSKKRDRAKHKPPIQSVSPINKYASSNQPIQSVSPTNKYASSNQPIQSVSPIKYASSNQGSSPSIKPHDEITSLSLSPKRPFVIKKPEWFKKLTHRSFRVVPKVQCKPTKRWPIKTGIPVLIHNGYHRTKVEVMQLHRRCLDDLADRMHPCRIPVTKAFRKTLEAAACDEWILHQWTSPNDNSQKQKFDDNTYSEHTTTFPLETHFVLPKKKSRFGKAHLMCLGAWLCIAWAVHASLNSYNWGEDMDDLYCTDGDDWKCISRAVM